MRITKVLIRLPEDRFSRIEAHIVSRLIAHVEILPVLAETDFLSADVFGHTLTACPPLNSWTGLMFDCQQTMSK